MAAASTEQAVLNLFVSNNKPYSLQNLCDLLAHQGFKKAAITKAVDALVESGKVTGKEYGKSKIFLPSQAGAKVLSKEEMAEKQAAIKAHQAELQAEREATKAVEQELAALKSSLTVEQMQQELAALKRKHAELAPRLEGVKSGTTLVSAEERAAVEAAFIAAMDAWRKRKGIFRNIWSSISESLEGRKDAEIFEEMGVDTDESIGADMKGLEALLPSKRRKF